MKQKFWFEKGPDGKEITAFEPVEHPPMSPEHQEKLVEAVVDVLLSIHRVKMERASDIEMPSGSRRSKRAKPNA